MKVLFDFSTFKERPCCSMDIYAIRLLNGYKTFKYDYELCMLVSNIGYPYLSSLFPDYEYVIVDFVANRNLFHRVLRYANIRNAVRWIKTINSLSVDVVLCPYTDIEKIWRIKPHRLQVIHDIHGRYVTKGIEKLKHIIYTPFLLRSSDSIIAISEFVKDEIMLHYSNMVKHKKLYRVYNSVIISNDYAEYKLSSKLYILYVNAIREYKNIYTLIKAFNELKDVVTHNLVIVGKRNDYWERVIIPYIKEKNLLSRIELIEYATDAELNYLYKNAAVFVSPSLYEGFGYTPIEAAMHAIPVITTKTSSLYEVTHGKVYYYDPPQNEFQLSKLLKQVLLTPPSKQELLEISKDFRELYKPSSQVRNIDCVIRKCIN